MDDFPTWVIAVDEHARQNGNPIAQWRVEVAPDPPDSRVEGPMKRTKTSVAVTIAAAALLPFALAACSSSSDANKSASPVASSGMVGGDPGTWSPVQLTMDDNGKTVDLVVGQAVIINGLPANDDANKIVVKSDNEAVAMPMQGDGKTTNYGFTAAGEGTAQVIVWDEDPNGKLEAQPVVQYTVNVTAK